MLKEFTQTLENISLQKRLMIGFLGDLQTCNNGRLSIQPLFKFIFVYGDKSFRRYVTMIFGDNFFLLQGRVCVLLFY